VTPLPDTRTGAAIAFYVILGTFLLLEQRVRWRSWRNPGGSRVDRGSLLIVGVSIAVAVVAAFKLAESGRGAIAFARWPIFIFGLVVMVMGIVLRQWSVTLLGDFFTVDVRVHPGQPVVDTGPYRWLRHPSYTGMIITFVGIGLALGNWESLLVLAIVPTAGLMVRIRAEERALLEQLGEPYRRFAKTRARLIPHVW
jgi:protein-S-isoprenylcysteine O-methyltransferase Ste14